MPSFVFKKNYPWIASLYFFQSMPFAVVTLVSLLIYQQHGINNAKSALLSSILILPWILKPVFAPFLELRFTKKNITIFSEFFISLLFLLLAALITSHQFIMLSVPIYTAIALLSSVHDTASDGLYLINLTDIEQKKYVALRTIFYQIGTLTIKGGLIIFAVFLGLRFNIVSWRVLFLMLACMSMVLTWFHWIVLPVDYQKNKGVIEKNGRLVLKSILNSYYLFPLLLLGFFYNITDAEVQKIIPLFMLDKIGLNLNITQVSEIFGSLGMVLFLAGVFVSSLLLGRYSLIACLKNITLIMLISHALFLVGLHAPNQDLFYVIIIFNQFISGIMNGIYMGYLLFIANKSKFPMTVYTLCTSIMALSYLIFGALSGIIESQLGYFNFFLYIFLANIILFCVTSKITRHYV